MGSESSVIPARSCDLEDGITFWLFCVTPGCPGVEIWNTQAILSGNLGCAVGGAQKVAPALVFGLVHQVSASESHVQFCAVCVVVMSLFKEFHS